MIIALLSLWWGCTQAPSPTEGAGAAPAPTTAGVVADAEGMVPVPAGWVELGARQLGPVPGFVLPPAGGAPGNAAAGAHDPSAQGEGGAARAAGAPPPLLKDGPGGRPPIRPEDRLSPRRVWVSAFRIDRTEVTRAAYAKFLVATGYRLPEVDEGWARDDGWNWTSPSPPEGTADHPVVLVSWYDATEYCEWRGARLPTEAEWQLAALGPAKDGRIFPWGNAWGDRRINHGQLAAPNFDDSDGYLKTSPVGAFPAGRSPYGLEDAFGNAWEFTSDRRVGSWDQVLHQPYQDGWTDVHAPMPGLYVAVRGGSYYFDFRINPAGERHAFLPELRRKTSGLRCAADLP